MHFTTRITLARMCFAMLVIGVAVGGCRSGVEVDSTTESTAVNNTNGSSTSAATPVTTTSNVPLEVAGFTLAAVGDWFADDPASGRYVEDAEQTRDAIIEAAPLLLLGLGDFTYDGSSAQRFFEFIEPLGATIPIYPAYGNHDGIVGGEVTRPDFYRSLREHFAVSEEWYSFDVGPIHFISINSEYPEGSAGFETQFAELSDDLAKAFADDAVRAIIPFFHRAMANPISADGPDRSLQEFVHPLLDRYSAKIPLALQAHHHVYTRTHAIEYSEARDRDRCRDTERGTMCEALYRIVDQGTGTSPTSYGPEGIVFVTVGTGGGYATGLTPDRPFVAIRIRPVSTLEDDPPAGTFGYLHLTLDEGFHFIEGQYRANNGEILDWFSIELP